MADPFAVAFAALLRAPGSDAATYTPPYGEPVPLRVIITTTPVDIQLGQAIVQAGSTLIQFARADVPAPETGAIIETDAAERFEILGVPKLDVERVGWLAEAAEAED